VELGAFSISLSVKDLDASQAFYEKLGFEIFGGEPNQNWLIMKNGDHIIGLFQGMFEGYILTFNPGWDQDASELESFMDVRDIQKQLKDRNIELLDEVDKSNTEGPASIMLADPDGNMILIDQHR